MKFLTWWTNRLKTDFTPKGLFVRVAVDLSLSNMGLFLGILTTVGIYIFSSKVTPRVFFNDMFIKVWLANVLPLTLCCLFAYAVNGLYRGTRNLPYLNRILIVSKAVGTAFCFFLVWIFIMKPFIPRTTMITGWIAIFVLILSSRLFWTAFSRQYRLVPADAEEMQVETHARELALMSQQDGWLPPEGLPPKAAWPYFADDEVMAAAAVLKSGKINQWTGREVKKFQVEFAEFCGVRHAIALANGSVALDLALHVLGIGPGNEVIVTPRTFVASAGCVALHGAKPIFADVDLESQNITAESIRKVITPRTRAIIAVHLAGCPCDMDPILELAGQHGLKVIEDCAQCHGARARARRDHRTGRRPSVSAYDGQHGTYGGLLLLPGQDHVDGRRRGHAVDG